MSNSKESNINYLLWRITKLWQREFQKVLDGYNSSISQLELLACILHLNRDEHQEEVTQIQLSQLTDIDPMTTSTILRNLEKKGLVIRKQAISDTRARSIHITEEGKELCCAALGRVEAIQSDLLSQIDGNSIIGELQKLLYAIENMNINDNKINDK